MRRAMPLLLLAGMLAGCAPGEATRKEAPLPEEVRPLRGTYSLVPFDETVAVGVFNSEVLKGLEAALSSALGAKGYRQVNVDADILVALYVVREGSFQSHDWGYRRGWKTPEWDAYWLERRAASRDLEEGTIVIDIIDPGGKTRTWTGSAPGVLFPGAEGARENEEAEKAIAGIIGGYR